MANVWRLIAAHNSDATGVVNLIRKTGQIRIGWGDTGDLSQSPCRSARDVSHAIWVAYPGSTNFRLGGSSLWRFYHEMQIGDSVVVSSKRGKQLTVEITGPYQWRPDPPPPLTPDYRHCRTVALAGLDPNAIFNQARGMAVGENSRWTLFRCASQVIPEHH